MRRRSIGPETGAVNYEHGSQGLLAGLLNRVLFRGGTQSLLARILHGGGGRGGLETRNSLLLTDSSAAADKRSHGSRRPVPLSLDTRHSPAPPSLLSGFTSFLDHEHSKPHNAPNASHTGGPNRDNGDDDTAGPMQSAEEFTAVLEETPASEIARVLAERRDEYSELLRKLERARRAAARQLNNIDERIGQAANERRIIDERIAAAAAASSLFSAAAPVEPPESSPSATEAAAVDAQYEQDDVPRLRQLAHVLVGHYGAITGLDYDPVLGLVAAGSVDTQARVWDAATGANKYVVGGHSDSVRGVQFYDGFLLTASSDSRIRMWDLALLDSVQPQAHGASTTPPMSPSMCRSIAPVDLCCETAFMGHADAITCFHAADGTLISGSADRTVREWDLATGALRQSIDVTWATRHAPRATRTDVPPRGTERGDAGFIGALQFYQCALATGTADGVLRLWDLRTGQAHRQLLGHTQPITSLQFDDRSVVSGSLDGSAMLWDLRTGRVMQHLKFAAPVTSVRLVRQRSAGYAAYDAQCWVAASDSALHHCRASSMQRVAYASDYGLLGPAMRHSSAFGADNSATITRIHHCADDDTLVSGDSSGTVKLWKI
ncbi:Mitochondrial fission protein [Coemansia sp. RSA 2322]|nr:Mitochondrial fission protein [Coemansia sp. RSA 2322]